MTTTTTINGEKRSFKNADNMKRYIMRFGDKTKKYTYKGTSDEMFMDQKGVIFYKDGWKDQKPETGKVYSIDPKTGSYRKDVRYHATYSRSGEDNRIVTSSDSFNEAVEKGVVALAKNRKSKVYLYDGDKRIGRISSKNNYPIFIERDTKKSRDIYNGGRVSGLNGFYPEISKQVNMPSVKATRGWWLMGKAPNSRTYRYYTGEAFGTKKEYAYTFKTYQDAEKFVKNHLMYMGGYDEYEYKIVREA